mgnify:CR=1 FL=1|jgi:glycosyltransferase involved in cell wall biosynthesis
MCINVAVFPKSSQNPYVANFYSELDSKEVHILDKVKWEFPLKADVLHIQWPEAWLWSQKKEIRKKNLKFILLCASKHKSIGLKVVNTVHNLRPHKKQTFFERVVYWYITRKCDGFIHLTEAGMESFFKKHRWAKRKKNTVIYHPSYEAQLCGITKSEARKKLSLEVDELRIVFFGRILPYKGVNNLIDAYLESVEGNGTSLWIGGPSDEESTQQIVSRVSGDDSIEFSPGFVDDAYLELQVKAADWVVLPYSSGLNSGVAIYALSCGTRAIVPDSPVMREMEQVTRFPSFKYFSKDNFREVLDSVLSNGRMKDPTPDNSKLDPAVIGEQYHEFLNKLSE